MRVEILKRSEDYLSNKENTSGSAYSYSEGVQNAIDHVFNDVISKVSKRNIEALGRVNFSANYSISLVYLQMLTI